MTRQEALIALTAGALAGGSDAEEAVSRAIAALRDIQEELKRDPFIPSPPAWTCF